MKAKPRVNFSPDRGKENRNPQLQGDALGNSISGVSSIPTMHDPLADAKRLLTELKDSIRSCCASQTCMELVNRLIQLLEHKSSELAERNEGPKQQVIVGSLVRRVEELERKNNLYKRQLRSYHTVNPRVYDASKAERVTEEYVAIQRELEYLRKENELLRAVRVRAYTSADKRGSPTRRIAMSECKKPTRIQAKVTDPLELSDIIDRDIHLESRFRNHQKGFSIKKDPSIPKLASIATGTETELTKVLIDDMETTISSLKKELVATKAEMVEQRTAAKLPKDKRPRTDLVEPDLLHRLRSTAPRSHRSVGLQTDLLGANTNKRASNEGLVNTLEELLGDSRRNDGSESYNTLNNLHHNLNRHKIPPPEMRILEQIAKLNDKYHRAKKLIKKYEEEFEILIAENQRMADDYSDLKTQNRMLAKSKATASVQRQEATQTDLLQFLMTQAAQLEQAYSNPRPGIDDLESRAHPAPRPVSPPVSPPPGDVLADRPVMRDPSAEVTGPDSPRVVSRPVVPALEIVEANIFFNSPG